MQVLKFMLSDDFAHFIITKEKEIIQLIEPLYEDLNKTNELINEKDYLNLISQIIKHSKNIDKFYFKIFTNLGKTIVKNKGIDIDLYCLINYFFMYSNKEIDTNLIYMNNIDNIIQSISYCSSLKNNLYISNIYESWIMNCKQIPSQHVDYILQNAFDKLNYIYFNSKNQKLNKEDCYNYLSYFSLMLHAIPPLL